MIYVGKIVNLKPNFGKDGGGKPMRGRVVYLHPEHRYFCAEFQALRGTFRECFPCPAEMRKRKIPVYERDRGFHAETRKRTGDGACGTNL